MLGRLSCCCIRQHVSAWLTCADFDKRKARLLDQGFKIAQKCTIPSSGVRLVYFATDTIPGGLIFEISDLLEPEHYERIQNIAKAAANWNGEQSIILETAVDRSYLR